MNMTKTRIFIAFFCFAFLIFSFFFWKGNSRNRFFVVYFGNQRIETHAFDVKNEYLEVADEKGNIIKIPIIDVENIEEVEIKGGKK